MGIENRDWYRREPSGAWKTRWTSPSTTAGGGVGVRPGAWLAIGVTVVAVAATSHFSGLLPISLPGPSIPTATVGQPPAVQPQVALPVQQPPARTPAAAPDNIVRLTPGPRLDVRVRQVQSWTLRDSRFGTLSVVVPVGKTPREAMIVALAERGYQVVG